MKISERADGLIGDLMTRYGVETCHLRSKHSQMTLNMAEVDITHLLVTLMGKTFHLAEHEDDVLEMKKRFWCMHGDCLPSPPFFATPGDLAWHIGREHGGAPVRPMYDRPQSGRRQCRWERV